MIAPDSKMATGAPPSPAPSLGDSFSMEQMERLTIQQALRVSGGNRTKAAGLLGDGQVVEVDPPRRLVHTMRALWSDEVRDEGFSRVTWDIEPVGDSCRLTVTHDELREGANDQLYGGWPMILSGLKTWLETGELLTTPGSLQYT